MFAFYIRLLFFFKAEPRFWISCSCLSSNSHNTDECADCPLSVKIYSWTYSIISVSSVENVIVPSVVRRISWSKIKYCIICPNNTFKFALFHCDAGKKGDFGRSKFSGIILVVNNSWFGRFYWYLAKINCCNQTITKSKSQNLPIQTNNSFFVYS